MKSFVNIFKGIAVGLANVVAGLSGGTVAVILRAYDAMLDICTNIFKHPIVTLKKHWMFLFGIIIGIIGGAIALEKLYRFAPLPVSMLFCGIVIASFIHMTRKVIKEDRPNWKLGLSFIIAVSILIIIPFLTNGHDKTISFNAVNLIILVGLGAIAASAMIIPGVSGSMVLASMGYYEGVLGLVSDFMSSLVHFNMSSLGYLFVECLFFAIGCVLGLVLCAILIKKLFTSFKAISNYAILGLVGGSSIAMMLVVLINKDNSYLFNSSKGLWMWITGVILFVVGLYLGSLLNKVEGDNNMEFTKDEFLKRASSYREEWIKLTTKLVSFNSVLDEYKEGAQAPFGEGNKEVLNWILAHAKEDGFDTYNCDNYAGHIAFGQGDETLGLLAHLDVVPAVGKWTSNPFDATLTDNGNRLVGRGVNDDKGPLAATYLALKILRDMGVKPNKRILLIMGCDEETGSRCLEHYFKKNPMPDFGFSPDACFPCINGEKVGVHYDITGEDNSHVISFTSGQRYNIVPDEAKMTLDIDLKKEYLAFLNEHNYKGEVEENTYIAHGLSAHAMCPQNGINAAFILFEFLNEYAPSSLSNFVVNYLDNDPFGHKLQIDVFHEEMKELTQNLGIVRIENKQVHLGVDCRVPVEGHEPLMQKNLDKALENTGLKAVVSLGGKLHYVPRNSELVKTLMSAYQNITGDMENESYTIGGGTYAKFIDNAVAFGPQFVGREDVDHQTDEYVYVDDYIKTMAIYADAIYRLVK